MPRPVTICSLTLMSVGSLLFANPLPAQDPDTGRIPWTLETAVEQLELHPRDPYLQYVALQLARNAGQEQLQEVAETITRFRPNLRFQRRNDVDLFSLTSGALAVQESLQLDAMVGEDIRAGRDGRSRNAAGDLKKSIEIGSLKGPTIQSHPFEKMLSGRKPEVSPLASAVPDDFFYVRFHSLSKLLDVMDRSDLWATHLAGQVTHDAFSYQIGDRLKQQLCLETSGLLRPFYDLVVTEVAVTGSDLFVREGSDVAVLFSYHRKPLFDARMQGFLKAAQERRKDAVRTTGRYRNVEFTHLATSDREVHVFAADLKDGLHIRCNSKIALQRIIDTIKGPAQKANGDAPQSLAQSLDFLYMRTLFEIEADEEDGFIFLSDAFIRRLVGPQIKITERRRMLCYNHLRMLGHASLLFRTQHGKAPGNVDELIRTKCLPEDFGKTKLACPHDGRYTLTDDAVEGVCSVHGRAGRMTPCCEIHSKEITPHEARLYGNFLTNYNSYWRTFFDPIGVRIRSSPDAYRLETIILPLIDNTVYSSLAQALGGKPVQLDAAPAPKRNIFSVAIKYNRDELIAEDKRQTQKWKELAGVRERTQALRNLGLAFHNYHDSHRRFPPAEAEHSGLSWRVHLLPYVGERELYKKFKLDEPWDSEHNKLLLNAMPTIYGEKGTKTQFVCFSGETAFAQKGRGLGIVDIRDGVSNTLLVVRVGPDRAVPWTKPQDLPFDPDQPRASLGKLPGKTFDVLLADGSVYLLPTDIEADTLKALVTYAGQEQIDEFPGEPVRFVQDSGEIDDAAGDLLRTLGIEPTQERKDSITNFFVRGIGDQLSVHIYDNEPTFDFSLPRFLGQIFSAGGLARGLGSESLLIGTLVSSLNSPVYIAVPVRDEKIVDQFLDDLTPLVSAAVRKPTGGGFIEIKRDYYVFPQRDATVRCFAIEFAGLRFRFFIARIDKGLYIATQPFIISDLIELAEKTNAAPDRADPDSVGHMVVRIRPENWSEVLPSYRLGWAEANRASCLQNQGRLLGIARSGIGNSHRLLATGEQLHGVRYFCPDAGQYDVEARGGKTCCVRCSVHGSVDNPRQRSGVTPDTASAHMADNFAGLTTSLTFTEEGLRAVLRVDRKVPNRRKEQPE